MEAPTSVAAVMDGVDVWWAVAGGWAIDLWLGEQTREHHDVEVVVRRRDQHAIHRALADRWELFAPDPPAGGWRPWSGVPIEAPAFQLQARSPSGEFDIFTETVDDTGWHFRRDDRISMASDEVFVASASGIPIVRPEIQLLYMAKSTDPKNQLDFMQARPHLADEAAMWLTRALEMTLPGHHWLEQLAGSPLMGPSPTIGALSRTFSRIVPAVGGADLRRWSGRPDGAGEGFA